MTLRPFRILPILLMTVVTIFLTDGSAQACVCGVPGMAESYSSAATIFIGKAEFVTRQFEDRAQRDDWGYHELTDAGDGFLRHEVLFSWGGTLLTEFRELKVTKIERERSSIGNE
jgi:hypothetical protein